MMDLLEDEWEMFLSNQTQIDKARQPILEKLAKLGYKFDNGLLIKI